MIELLFAACLSGAPVTCEDRSIWFIDTSTEECQSKASGQLTKWSAVNPGWEVTRWTCAPIEMADAQMASK